MKAKIELSGHHIKEAIEEYMTRKGLKCGPGDVVLSATPGYDALDRPSGLSNITATATVEIGDVIAQV